MSEAGVLALTVGGTAPEFHLACYPIKPSLTLGHHCLAIQFSIYTYIICPFESQTLYYVLMSTNE